MVVFGVTRRSIIRAKAEEGWYDGAAVRVSASVTADPPDAWPLWWLHAVAHGIVLAALVATVVLYPGLPDPLPTHWNADGEVDGWAAKSWAAALAGPLLGLALVVGIAILCAVVARVREPLLPDGHPDAARRTALARRRGVQVMVALTSVAMAVTFAVVTALPLVRMSRSAVTVLVWATLVAALLPALWLVIDTARRQRAPAAEPGASGPKSPDDDRHWKAGLDTGTTSSRSWAPSDGEPTRVRFGCQSPQHRRTAT